MIIERFGNPSGPAVKHVQRHHHGLADSAACLDADVVAVIPGSIDFGFKLRLIHSGLLVTGQMGHLATFYVRF